MAGGFGAGGFWGALVKWHPGLWVLVGTSGKKSLEHQKDSAGSRSFALRWKETTKLQYVCLNASSPCFVREVLQVTNIGNFPHQDSFFTCPYV